VLETWAVRRDPLAYARSIGVEIGENCHLWGITSDTFGSEPYLIKIGNNVTITHECSFLTHDGGIRIFRKHHPNIDVIAPIIIKDNVFLGAHTLVMPGVVIGENSIIGAGSLVTRSIPPNVVAVGRPAKPIKTLEQYWDGIKDKTLPTFNLAPSQKRKFLKQHFQKMMSEA
jgi:acetyltransferase-like isoleucine patch superfamily enzyme